MSNSQISIQRSFENIHFNLIYIIYIPNHLGPKLYQYLLHTNVTLLQPRLTFNVIQKLLMLIVSLKS
jgi:hypothetical protein